MRGFIGLLIAATLWWSGAAHADGIQNNNCAIKPANPADSCFVTGVLTVPFKYELSGNKDVFGAASLNGFVGWNVKGYATLIGFVGYSSNLNPGNSPSTPSQSASTGAVSYGFGVAFPVGGTMNPSTKDGQAQQVSQVHVGAVLGFDHEGSSLGYQYNNKPWFSVFVGTSF